MLKIPTLQEFQKAGFKVDVVHLRNFKVAYYKPYSTELLTRVITGRIKEVKELWKFKQLLPSGGKTEVTVTDPKTGVEFYGFSLCRETDNYNKQKGVAMALHRIYQLMLVCEGQDGFSIKDVFKTQD